MTMDPFGGRIGLNVPNEWWPSPAMLKSLEAAGFARVQVHAPPASVLSDPGQCERHASGLATVLGATRLKPVVHSPSGLRVGTPAGDRATDGLLAYAAEIGASHIVYHACALPDAPESKDVLLVESRSLAALAPRAERLGVTIAIENLAPVFPGAEPLSANPMVLRGLAHRISSDRVGLCLDLGHAHIVAELRRTPLEALIHPVLDVVTLFHLHDNFGARWRPGSTTAGLDPLRLDLHLPPGRGTLPWTRLLPDLANHRAPAMLEVHPPHRQRATDLHHSFHELVQAPERAALAA
jgi:sugar phosphate isomerase/epimerase